MQHDPVYEETFDEDISQNLEIDRRITGRNGDDELIEKLLGKLEEHKEF